MSLVVTFSAPGRTRMYTDQRVSGNGEFYTCKSKMIREPGTNRLIGLVGDNSTISMAQALMRAQGITFEEAAYMAYQSAKETEEDPSIGALIVDESGAVGLFQSPHCTDELVGRVQAIGSGANAFLALWEGFSRTRKDPHTIVVACFSLVSKVRTDVAGCVWDEVLLS